MISFLLRMDRSRQAQTSYPPPRLPISGVIHFPVATYYSPLPIFNVFRLFSDYKRIKIIKLSICTSTWRVILDNLTFYFPTLFLRHEMESIGICYFLSAEKLQSAIITYFLLTNLIRESRYSIYSKQSGIPRLVPLYFLAIED